MIIIQFIFQFLSIQPFLYNFFFVSINCFIWSYHIFKHFLLFRLFILPKLSFAADFNTFCKFFHSFSMSISSFFVLLSGVSLTATEMKYMRRTAGYTWTDYQTNAQIAKELKITPTLDKLLEYKRSWIQHVNRMPRKRLPRVMKHYSPTGRRNHGRPLKRLLDT